MREPTSIHASADARETARLRGFLGLLEDAVVNEPTTEAGRAFVARHGTAKAGEIAAIEREAADKAEAETHAATLAAWEAARASVNNGICLDCSGHPSKDPDPKGWKHHGRNCPIARYALIDAEEGREP